MKKIKNFLLLIVILSIITSLLCSSTFATTTQDKLFDITIPLHINGNTHNMQILNDGSLTVGNSTEVPRIFEGAKKYGIFTSDVIKTKEAFKSAFVNLDKIQQSPEDIVNVDIRGSVDESIWSQWIEVKDEETNFFASYNYLQIRISVATYSDTKPILKKVSIKLNKVSQKDLEVLKKKSYDDGKPINKALKPVIGQSPSNLVIMTDPVINPFEIDCYATHMTSFGGTTANGHVIQSTDKFVALPSFKCLCPGPNDTSYTVDITYGNKTVYGVPVWDVGPMNQKDDFWNYNYVIIGGTYYRNRDNWGYEGYGDLTRGYSEAWEAYVNSFHNGWSSSHPTSTGTLTKYVSDTQPGTQVHKTKTNPLCGSNHLNKAEIDLSDAVYKALGMTDNGYVNVTFNFVSE